MRWRPPSAVRLGAVGLVALTSFAFLPTNAVSLRDGRALLLEWGLWLATASLISGGWWRAWWRWSALTTILRYNQLAFLAMTSLASALLVMEVLARRITEADLPSIVLGLRALALLQVAWMGLQQLGCDPLFAPVEEHGHPLLTGFLDNSRSAGAFLVILTPLFCRGRWRWALPAILLACAGTRSSGVVLTSLVVGALIARGLWRWAWWKIAALNAVLLALIILRDPAAAWYKVTLEWDGARFMVWRAMLALCAQDAWTFLKGWGMGQFAAAYKGIVDVHHIAPAFLNWRHPHNEYLLLLFNQGAIGLGLVLGYLAVLARTLRARWGELAWETQALACALAGWLVVAGWWFPAHTAELAVVGVVLVGLLEGVRRGLPTGVVRPRYA